MIRLEDEDKSEESEENSSMLGQLSLDENKQVSIKL